MCFKVAFFPFLRILPAGALLLSRTRGKGMVGEGPCTAAAIRAVYHTPFPDAGLLVYRTQFFRNHTIAERCERNKVSARSYWSTGEERTNRAFFLTLCENFILMYREKTICHQDGVSNPLAVLFCCAITLILAALLLLMLLSMLGLYMDFDKKVPELLQIKAVYHHTEEGRWKLDSRVSVYHTGKQDLENNLVWAEFLKNNQRLQWPVKTCNGYNFVPTAHFGVQKMMGMGCRGNFWSPGEKIVFDFSDGTFVPGDLVTAEFFLMPGKKIISRHSFRA